MKSMKLALVALLTLMACMAQTPVNINGPRSMTVITTPAPPASGQLAFYAKAGTICVENSGSTETCLGSGGSGGVFTTVTFSATPTFTCTALAAPQTFKLTLTGNVTSSTLASCTQGQPVTFQIYQDGTGGRSLVWPTNVTNPPTIIGDASAYTTFTCWFDGTNCIATPAVSSASYSLSPTTGAPSSSPASGFVKLWTDTTLQTLMSKNSSGANAGMIYGSTCTASFFASGITAGSTINCTQPHITDIVNGAPNAPSTITTSANLSSANDGIPVRANCSSACNVTVVSGLGSGFYTAVWQVGAGQVTIVQGSGVTLVNAHGASKTFGTGAPAVIYCDAADHCLLGGDVVP